ncbi:hypothetical protein H2198_006353 [Neophaeococcomyces mojaviensis]|uniref:Uncharacterized protein n=1 Tax=Neophaeococcomyces mojaviensis TaxID=3383035 RepID=A0ACC3A355_9EURO|nr:hypothetical protein H2198_006353 [Knufia sp. JES_112]
MSLAVLDLVDYPLPSPFPSEILGCPYSIQLLTSSPRSHTYVIRENDHFGEYPNIYAKVYYGSNHVPSAIILSDSGTGLSSDDGWNIAVFLSSTINPNHSAPYVVLTTHCHYDHICGIQQLLNAKANVTVLSSSHDLTYLTPWEHLQKHSLCEKLGLRAPVYDARWIEDGQNVGFWNKENQRKEFSSITVIHTPGHTPDSLSWYDHETSALSVGDMFYEKESDETRSGSNGRWPREPPQPVIFNEDSNIVEWNASMHRLLDFVRFENRRLASGSGFTSKSRMEQDGFGESTMLTSFEDGANDWTIVTASQRRVALCAAHVTIATDAEFALLDMLSFMLRVQLDQVPRIKVCDPEGKLDIWLWDDCKRSDLPPETNSRTAQINCQYSVQAPWQIIHGH